MWHRIKPALSLVVLAPFIAEYLLGSLTFGQLVLFPLMALMYGAGALFVREAARRSSRGWPAIILLGLAYGVIEEGLGTQSLFNPHYLGLRLLDYGFIPSLGIGAPWTVYVVILHAVWSVAVPIALVEALFADRRTVPWLRMPGFVLSGVFFALGVALVAFGTHQKEKFAASPAQLAAAAICALIFAAAAFVCFRPAPAVPANDAGPAKWRPFSLGLLSFLTGSAFHLVTQFGSAYLSPVAAVGIALSLPAIVIFVIHRNRTNRTPAQTDALMIGALLAYCWLGFFLTVRLHGRETLAGQCFPCAVILLLLWGRFVRPNNFNRPSASTAGLPSGTSR